MTCILRWELSRAGTPPNHPTYLTVCHSTCLDFRDARQLLDCELNIGQLCVHTEEQVFQQFKIVLREEGVFREQMLPCQPADGKAKAAWKLGSVDVT